MHPRSLVALILLAGCVDSTAGTRPDPRLPAAPSVPRFDVAPNFFAPPSLSATASAGGTEFPASDVLIGHFSEPIVYDFTISETLTGSPVAKGVVPATLGLGGYVGPGGCSYGGSAAILVTPPFQGRFAAWSGCEAYPASTGSGRFTAFGDTYLRLSGMPQFMCDEGFESKPCYNWSGSTTISMTKVDGEFMLTTVTSLQPASELAVAHAGDALGIVRRAFPVQAYTTNGGTTSWRFVADDGTGDQPVCDDYKENDYCSTFIRKSGTFIVSGFINGSFKPAKNTVHVTVPGSGATLALVKAEGLNPGGSFTLLKAERPISLEAKVTPSDLAASVRWVVEDAPGDAVTTAVPATMPTGATATISLPTTQDPARDRYRHQQTTRLDDKALSVRVHAEITAGGQTISTDSKIVSQDQVDVLREEYLDLGLAFGVPARSRFTDVARGSQNRGDFDKGILDPTFMGHLNAFKTRWLEANSRFQINVIYRSPVHNKLHSDDPASGGFSSGTATNSMHVYGCAADIQTFPFPRDTPARKQAAIDYWEDMAAVAREDTAFRIEQRVAPTPPPGQKKQLASTESHVHLQACARALP